MHVPPRAPAAALFATLLALAPAAPAQETARKAAPKPAPAATKPAPAAARPAAPAAAPAGGANAVTQAAVQKGVLACAGRIEQVSNFLGFSPQAGALLMAPPSQPDQRLVPLVMEVPAGAGNAYASASFAPNQANGCGATYDAVVYWTDTCDAVAGRQFAGLKRLGQLKKDVAVLDGGPATKVFLMPAGSGCVSIKKEVVL